jgi:hypothetical protein
MRWSLKVAYVLVEDGAGVLFVVDQHSVGAFFADAADEPLCITVGSRRVGRDLDDVEAFGGEDSIEGVGELGVPVADQEAERGDLIAQVHQEVDFLAPGGARVTGLLADGRPAGLVGVSPLPGEETAVPGQQGGGGDDPMPMQLARETVDQGEQRA